MNEYLSSICKEVIAGNQTEVIELVDKALKNGILPLTILKEGLTRGIESLGAKFKAGEVYLPEILISIRAMNMGLNLLKPYFKNSNDLQHEGTIVLGTIEGDIHDIGKNLVRLMLEGTGFRVVDLGVNVSASSFVSAVCEHKADIVGISALLTTTMINIPNVIQALKQNSLCGRVPVLVGGACITREFADDIGAEGYALDCTSAPEEAKRLLRGREKS